VVRSHGDEPFVLRGRGTACRIRPWSNDPDIAQMIFASQRRLPTPSDVLRWIDELGELGYTTVRTGALNNAQARLLEPFGFVEMQRLALLEHRSPRALPHVVTGSTRRLLQGDYAAASTVDERAFGQPWGLDVAAIADVCAATRRHRARWVADDDGVLVAYAISGRDSRVGFLQRLAVDPADQRRGHGRALVVDSLHWAARWRIERVLVNTHVGNEGALDLYASTGFERLDDELTVLERRLGACQT
jgi:ribosomal protein S18 acetylase RimI-like enzyme